MSKVFFAKGFVRDPADYSAFLRFELVGKLWPDSRLSQQALQDTQYSDTFIAYVETETTRLQKHKSRFAAKTIEDTVNLIHRLKCDFDKPRGVVLDGMRNLFRDVDDAALIQTLKLALRLWLTIDVRLEVANQPSTPTDISAIEWPVQLSLQEALRSHFVSSELDEWYEDTSRSELDPSLTASSLVDICCIKLIWTNNLAEHLHLDKRRRALSIYEHKICLLNHSKDPNPPIPHPTLYEAIDTLNLLFPFGHEPTRELLRREKRMALYRLGICSRARTLKTNEYRVWGPRLMELVELFNEPPKNWWQLLSDRRNLRDWATFWTGVMVLILTLVSIAFGTVSTIYTIKQYNLALAQACASPDLAGKMPKFCS